MPLPGSILLAVLIAATAVTAQLAQRDATHEQQRFETEVRPLLARRCFSCHGSDKQRSELRLDHLTYALHGGARGAALVPGHPEASRLVTAIGYEDVDLQMPPKKRLDDAEIAILTEWIARGAFWPDEPVPEPAHAADAAFDLDERRRTHWAWREPQRPELPAVRDTAWPLQPVDRFVLARLEDAGLEPAADADRETWLRRVAFDLTGLPPTPSEIDAFVEDDADDAFEKVVDRMLGSRHFGERWARHWLDLVRYSETLGHEYDYPVPYAWRYRDYVVRAFNGDVPYDQFVREHVAGDLLPQPRRNADDGSNESVIGTAFYWFGDQSHSPVDARQATADRIDNQVDVLGKTFLGLTLGCARCHDHKFDAISTRDYYAMVGYLQSSRYSLTTIDPPDRERATLEHLAELQERLQRQARDAFRGEAARIERYLLAATAVEEQRVAEERSEPQPAADDKRELTRAERQARDRRQRAEQRRREAAQQRRLAANAAHFDVDAEWLRRWIDALRDGALRDGRHPLHAWRALTEERDDEVNVLERWRQLLGDERRQPPSPAAAPIVFADFDAHGYEGWGRDGLAFGAGPCRHGDSVVPGPDGRVLAQVLSGGWAHSGRLSRQLQGTLHSPTFDLEQRYVHVFAAGREARINVVLDGFNLIRAPIYGELKQIVNADDPRWFTIDLAMWRGHRAYLQFNDFTTPDPGDDARSNGYARDGFLAVQRVVFSDDRQPPVAASADVRDLLGDRPIASREALAQRYARAARQALDDWQAQRSHPGVLTAPQGALLNWLFGRELLRPDDALRSTLQLYQRLEATIPPPTLVPAMTDGSGENARVNIRGNPNELGDVVPRRLLQALDGAAAADASSHGQECGSGRLQLANAMTDRRNPLLARTLVNRVWHHLFGRGLVATTDNFGVLGGEPTHPQLLDWLAEEFVEGGWSIKATIRALVLSRIYRMASTGVALADAIDPDNALLHRMRIRRLQGEVIRDAVLAVSGRLDPRPFGPGVPVHLTRFMEGRGRPDRSGPLDGDGRRSIYLEVRRNFLNPLFVAFDTPPPFATVGCRSESNVPAQALTMLNDPFVHEQAERWAARVLAADMPPRERVQTMYRTAFGRRADAAEANAALAFLLEQSDLHGRPHDDLRSWSDLAHVLLNTKEFVLVR